MGKIVKYGINGVVERTIAIKLGNAVMNITFSGGVMDSAGVRPATYTTNNALEQAMIERHSDFKTGAIKVIKTADDAPAKVETPEMDVKTLQQARAYLMERGVPMELLQTKAAILSAAKDKGVEFPNIK